jgi:diguanylate cyclase (GGDEF)-like protein
MTDVRAQLNALRENSKVIRESSTPAPPPPTAGYCFVISQIGEEASIERAWADDVTDLVIDPAAQSLGLRILRPDRDQTPGLISPQMVRGILEAEVVIVDLTGHSPNVYYELGIADSFEKPVISLIDDRSKLPFDAKDLRTISLGAARPLPARVASAASDALAIGLREALSPHHRVRSLVSEVGVTRRLQDVASSGDPIALQLGEIHTMMRALMAGRPSVVPAPPLSSSLDPLTGLGSRQRLMEHLDEYYDASDASGFWLVIIDLDGFSSYNDSLGHSGGDRILVQVAGVVSRQAQVRDGTAHRIGGDEFAVVLPVRSPKEMWSAVDQISAALTGPGPAGISATFGAVHSASASTALTLLRRAEQAVATAKHRSSSLVVWEDLQIQETGEIPLIRVGNSIASE